MGWGGKRPGAGRPRKSEEQHEIDGTKPQVVVPFVVKQEASTTVAPAADNETVEPPAHLAPEVIEVWNELAPLALEARTLTKTTAYAFSLLCQNVHTERKTYVWNRGRADHRGLIQRIESELLAFGLRPQGEALSQPDQEETPPNPLARFGFRPR